MSAEGGVARAAQQERDNADFGGKCIPFLLWFVCLQPYYQLYKSVNIAFAFKCACM